MSKEIVYSLETQVDGEYYVVKFQVNKMDEYFRSEGLLFDCKETGWKIKSSAFPEIFAIDKTIYLKGRIEYKDDKVVQLFYKDKERAIEVYNEIVETMNRWEISLQEDEVIEELTLEKKIEMLEKRVSELEGELYE